MAKHSALLAVSAGLVGVLSYLCTLLMAHLLPPEQYTQYAAAQMLVGIVGIVAHALVPLPLAALVRRHAHRTAARREGMAFAVLVSVAAGAVAGLLTGGITAAFAPAHVAVATGVGVAGALHGRPRTGLAAGGAAVHALRRGLDPRGRGPAAGSAWWRCCSAGARPGRCSASRSVASCWSPGRSAMLRDVGWHPHVLREGVRWAETGDIALVQFVVSVLVGAAPETGGSPTERRSARYRAGCPVSASGAVPPSRPSRPTPGWAGTRPP